MALTIRPRSRARRRHGPGIAAGPSSAATSRPSPRTSTHAGERLQPVGQRRFRPPWPGRARPRPPSRRAPPCAAAVASGWPPKVVAWSPGSNTPATSARAQHAPIGTPLPSALAIDDDIGDDVEVLMAEPPAGATEPGLHLVDHEQDPPLVTQSADALEVLRGGRVDAALTLHRFEQHGGHRGIERPTRGRPGRSRRRDGTPRAAAGTPRASAAGRWRGGWPGCGRGTIRARSPRRGGPDRPTCGPASTRTRWPRRRELAKNTWPPPPSRRSRVTGDLPTGLGAEQVRHVQQRRGLLGQGLGRPPDGRGRARSPPGRTGSRGSALPSRSHSRLPSPRTNIT